ncbi:MAG: GIY-YIG nuclease family protein [Beijerinckiaceae bacterium]
MSKTYCIYIMTNKPKGVLYTGVTNDLERRVWQHRRGEGSEFVQKYNLFRLVYADTFGDVTEAIAAEKRIKKWRRAWKETLIEAQNPGWDDLMPAPQRV